MSAEPTPPTPGPPLTESRAGEFRTTQWTQVSQAKGDSPEGRRALAELCDAYYEPVATVSIYGSGAQHAHHGAAAPFRPLF